MGKRLSPRYFSKLSMVAVGLTNFLSPVALDLGGHVRNGIAIAVTIWSLSLQLATI